jgi:hypothetical protein
VLFHPIWLPTIYNTTDVCRISIEERGWNNALTLPPPFFIEILHTSVVLYIVGSHIGRNNTLTLPHSPPYRNHTSVVLYIIGSHIGWNNALTLPPPPLFIEIIQLLCCITTQQLYDFYKEGRGW